MYKVIKNGVEKRIQSWEIIIPLFDNNKIKFPEKVIENIKTKIIGEFSGLSEINCMGLWKSNTTIYKDENIILIIDIPVADNERAEQFFLELKDALSIELDQEKIYITKASEKVEIITVYEYLKELGFEINIEDTKNLNEENINKLVSQYNNIKMRLSYKTLYIKRDLKYKNIIWEREIFGIKLVTKIKDNFPMNFKILAADQLETYFTEELFGKPLIIIGDYEYLSYVLDKEKRVYVIGDPEKYKKYNKKGSEPMYGNHPWHGTLTTSAFIPTFVEQILINYIILRESGFSKEDINITVGSDGSSQSGGKKLLTCPASIHSKRVIKIIIKKLEEAINSYEDGTINEIALMQAKVLNRFNEKKGMIKLKL